MKVELYYFEGCPSYIETTENLKNALSELEIKNDFKLIEVINAEEATDKKFLGSPTIRINGTDLEHKDGDYVFACRIYMINGKMHGTPTKEYIHSQLKTFIKS